MKKIFYLCFIILVTACNEPQQPNKEKEKSDSLQAILENKDAVINTVLASLDEIESSLDTISGRQKYICLRTETPEKIKSVTIEGINRDITVINNIVKNNRQTITQLNQKLQQKNKSHAELTSSVNSLNTKLVNKQNELVNLKKRLSIYEKDIITLETIIGSLSLDNMALGETVEEETDMLHTAYYIVGTSKELQKDSVLDKTDGLFKIYKSPIIKKDFKTEKFEKIDFVETTAIPINHKKIKVITTHPSSSYHLDEEKGFVRTIIITDPFKFWETSKYLIVMKE